VKKIILFIILLISYSVYGQSPIRVFDASGCLNPVSPLHPVPVTGSVSVSGSATATRQDSLLALLKLIFYRNYLGTVSETPLYFSGIPQPTPVRDSLSGILVHHILR